MSEGERKTPWGKIAAVIGFIITVVGFVFSLDQAGLISVLPGSTASRAEAQAWAAIDQSEKRCEALRTFLRSFPDGAYKEEAQTLLDARTERQAAAWVSFSQPAVVVGTSSLEYRATREGACQSALEAAQRNAESGCDLYRGEVNRFRGVEAAMAGSPQCDCRDHAIRVEGGPEMAPVWRCSVRTSSHCRGETLGERTEEYCGE
jgi:hypothetical protein